MSLWDSFTNWAGISGSPSMANTDWSNMAAAGYTVPGMAGDTGSYNNVTNPTNWAGISKALGGDSTTGTGAGTTGTSSGVSNAATSTAQSSVGRPFAGAQSMDNVVNMLKKRQSEYMQAALDPSKRGTPVTPQQFTGLLGF